MLKELFRPLRQSAVPTPARGRRTCRRARGGGRGQRRRHIVNATTAISAGTCRRSHQRGVFGAGS
jgi:hypothetical protein